MSINTLIRAAFKGLAVASVALCFSSPAEAQRSCGDQIMLDRIKANGPAALAAFNAKRDAIYASAQTNTAEKTTAQYAIPVIFHIIVTQTQFNRMGGNAGIAYRVDSQIRVLNRDYTKTNLDLGNVPAPFVPLIGNAGITYGLANRTPDNQPTNGYEIKILPPGVDSMYDLSTGTVGSGILGSDAKYSGQKGLDAWDPSKYLNVWVVRLTNAGQESILGAATPPSFTDGSPNSLPYEERGIVLTYRSEEHTF